MKQYNLVSDCCNSRTKRKGEFTFCENCRQKCVLVKVKNHIINNKEINIWQQQKKN